MAAKTRHEMRAGAHNLEGNFYDKNMLSPKYALTLPSEKEENLFTHNSASRFCLFYVATLEYM